MQQCHSEVVPGEIGRSTKCNGERPAAACWNTPPESLLPLTEHTKSRFLGCYFPNPRWATPPLGETPFRILFSLLCLPLSLSPSLSPHLSFSLPPFPPPTSPRRRPIPQAGSCATLEAATASRLDQAARTSRPGNGRSLSACNTCGDTM